MTHSHLRLSVPAVRGDSRYWPTVLLALSVCAGCYESHAAAPHGVDAGDDVPPSLCPFPDEAVVVIDDTPGCRFVTVDASDGPDLCPAGARPSIVAVPVRASVRVVHEGRRPYTVGARARTDGWWYSYRMGDPRYRTGDRTSDCRCDHWSHGGGSSTRLWTPRVRAAGTETHLLVGTDAPGALVDVAVCVDVSPYAEDDALAL